MNIYVTDSLHENCSLLRVGLQKVIASTTSSVILRWNDVLSISKEERNTAGIRSEFNICNGISFGRKILGVSDCFGLAADIKNHDFPRQILLNSFFVRSLMDDLFRASTFKLISDHIINSTPHNMKQNKEIICLAHNLPVSACNDKVVHYI